jgi:hypothetical protein
VPTPRRSVLEAFLTLRHLADGGGEANPLMHLVLAYSPRLFLALKLSITDVAAWWLAAHQQFSLAQRGLYGLTLGYGVVLVYHLALVLRLVGHGSYPQGRAHLAVPRRPALAQVPPSLHRWCNRLRARHCC